MEGNTDTNALKVFFQEEMLNYVRGEKSDYLTESCKL